MAHRVLELGGHSLLVRDPDRRVHGSRGPTRVELLTYYMTAAPGIIPFLRGRPTSSTLVPDEVTVGFRFARTAPPGWAGRFPTYRLSGIGRPTIERYLMVPDGGTLAALVDQGCLSFHPWNSTAGTPMRPTQMVFNLDREAIAFREVRNAALLLRELLGDHGLAAWVKTSGGQGLHVLVPIEPGPSFDEVRLAAEMTVTRAMRREPSLFSRDPRRARRRGRIFIDISRNARGATLIAPYAVAPSGFVSALLRWEELLRPLYPEDFDMARVVARQRADLLNQDALFATRQSLERLLTRKRSGRWRRESADRVGECFIAETPAALIREAQRLGAKNRQVRGDAEVARIESSQIRSRARKVVEEARRSR